MMRSAGTRLSLFVGVLLVSRLLLLAEEVATFPSGQLALYGVLYKHQGTGPFAAVVYNHSSAPGMLSSAAFEALGPVLAGRG